MCGGGEGGHVFFRHMGGGGEGPEFSFHKKMSQLYIFRHMEGGQNRIQIS